MFDFDILIGSTRIFASREENKIQRKRKYYDTRPYIGKYKFQNEQKNIIISILFHAAVKCVRFLSTYCGQAKIQVVLHELNCDGIHRNWDRFELQSKEEERERDMHISENISHFCLFIRIHSLVESLFCCGLYLEWAEFVMKQKIMTFHGAIYNALNGGE